MPEQGTSGDMAKALVIVESPAKAKTINKYLGKQFVVKASIGHIKDLPKKELAVDVENGFRPKYEVIEGKKKLIQDSYEKALTEKNLEAVSRPDDPMSATELAQATPEQLKVQDRLKKKLAFASRLGVFAARNDSLQPGVSKDAAQREMDDGR